MFFRKHEVINVHVYKTKKDKKRKVDEVLASYPIHKTCSRCKKENRNVLSDKAYLFTTTIFLVLKEIRNEQLVLLFYHDD